MPTTSEMFETVTDWHQWNGAAHRARELDAVGRHTSAEQYRTMRDRHTVDPIAVLSASCDLIQFLTMGLSEAIAEARRRGATWEQVAQAVRRPASEIEAEYSAITDRIEVDSNESGGESRSTN